MKKRIYKQLLLIVCFLSCFSVVATTSTLANLGQIINKEVREQHAFYGLASYYNGINYYLLENEKLSKIDENTEIQLNSSQWFLAVGRFKVLIVQAEQLSFKISENNFYLLEEPKKTLSQSSIKISNKSELKERNPLFDQVRYAHLWSPLAWLAKGVETSLNFLHQYISNWGWVIVIFSVLLKIVMIPAGIMTVKFQRKVSQVKTALEPQLLEIKQNYDGEKAHNKIMAAHKQLGVSPFYTLKPILASFIQVPILIAVFNALGEMSVLIGQPFLWISDLAYPDSIASLPMAFPLFGRELSLLPVIMTLVTVFSTRIFNNKFASEKELKSQKVKLYLMAAAFFVLFYPFPAAMVLYWVLANILQTIQQQLIKI